MGTASQLLASKLLRHFNMKPLILLGLVALVRAQYSGETQDLSNSQLDALKDIFGDAAAGGAYSGQQVGRLEGGTNGVEAIIQVVKNEEGYVAPDDYQTTAGLTDKATTNVDNVFENCADYTATQTEPRPHQDRYVQNLDIHPEFNPRNLANDWAVLYTSQDFDLQAHIDTICLPQPEELFDFQTCFATGWGKDQFGAAGNYQVVLKEIDLPVVGHNQCEASLRTTRLGKRFKLDDSFICAGGVDGKDTCKGDGGSPLVCQSKFDPTSYVQAGIVAWGIGCGEDNTPGVYASVSKGVCWIDYAMTCQFGQQSGSYSSYWGYSAQQCQTWMDGELSRLNQEVAEMQNAGSLTGRKKAAALAKGLKAQETLNKYSQCNVFWQPIDAAPLTTGGNGYVDGGDLDISGFERKGPKVAQPSDSSAVKLTQGSSY